MEIFEPRNKKPRIFSMRINHQHRVIYTVDKQENLFASAVLGHIMKLLQA